MFGRRLKYCLLLLGFFQYFFVYPNDLDSLKGALNLVNPDTNTVINLNKIGWLFKSSNLDSAHYYSQKAFEVSKQINWLFGEARSLHQLGVFNKTKGDFDSSLEYYRRALEIWNQDNNVKGKSITLGNMGVVYRRIGDYPRAIQLYEEALEISQQLNDTSGIADNYTRLGLTYWEQGMYPKALEYYFDALAKYRQLMNEMRIGLVSGNIGLVYWNQQDFDNALKYYEISYKSDLKTDNKLGAANVLTNMGVCYMEKGSLNGESQITDEDLSKSIECYNKALQILEGSGNSPGISNIYGSNGSLFMHIAEKNKNINADTSNKYYEKALEISLKAIEITKEVGDVKKTSTWLGNVGTIYVKRKDFAKAELILKEALGYSETIGALQLIKSQNLKLSELFEAKGEYEKSLEHYKNYTTYKDSLYNDDRSKEIGKLEAGFEFERNIEEQKRAEEERIKIEEAAKKRKDNIQYSGIFVFVLLLFALVFMSGKFTMSQKVAEGLIFFTFLLFFEFCLVILDPYIEQLSNGEPLFKLALNAALAALIFPAHAFFEQTLKNRLIKRA